MVQNAIVKEVVREGVARVSLLREMECGMHCDGACAGCTQKPTEEILVLAENEIGAKAGDFVEVEPTGVTMQPLPDTAPDNLTDGIFAASPEEGGAYVDDTGKSPRGLAQTRPMCYSVNKDTPLKRKEPTPWH